MKRFFELLAMLLIISAFGFAQAKRGGHPEVVVGTFLLMALLRLPIPRHMPLQNIAHLRINLDIPRLRTFTPKETNG